MISEEVECKVKIADVKLRSGLKFGYLCEQNVQREGGHHTVDCAVRYKDTRHN